MKTLLLVLMLLGVGAAARAQNTTIAGNATLTNSLIVTGRPTKLYSVLGYNSAASTQYIQVFATNGVPANGQVPVLSMPVSATSPYSFDFGYYGADFDAITVLSSTTADTLTLSAANTSFQAITKSR